MGHRWRDNARDLVLIVPGGRQVVEPAYRTVRRYRLARSYYTPALRQIRKWAPSKTEDSNFYYGLTSQNRGDLICVVAAICGVDAGLAESYAREIESDDALRSHLSAALHEEPDLRDSRPEIGRRLGWYLFVRITKPRLVVETGVSHGVGACVLASALIRNAHDGSPGRYLGTDIDPRAGSLFVRPYSDVGNVVIGDSITTLKSIEDPIDVFINDSDHSAVYERDEYEVVKDRLADFSVVIGDNSHTTSELRNFSEGMGRPYLFFREIPRDHWYPGAGLGLSPSTLPLTPRPR